MTRRRVSSLLSLAERMEHYTDKSGECWIWTGPLQPNGYGRVHFQGSFWAHRVAWELASGRPIPDGLTIDHLCRVKRCVNPKHLEAITNAENARRGNVKESCYRGHPLAGDNLYIKPKSRSRACRACRRITRAAYYREVERAGRVA